MSKKRTAAARYVQPYRYPSPDIPISAIRRFARQIAERFHPEKIILFGSYAYGTPHAESDVDLLVIMPAYNEIAQAIRIRREVKRPFALDLVVKTPKRLERALRDENWFLREAVAKGKLLYEASNGTVGPQSGRGHRSRPRAVLRPAAETRHRLIPLPTGRGKVPQGPAPRTRRRLPEDA